MINELALQFGCNLKVMIYFCKKHFPLLLALMMIISTGSFSQEIRFRRIDMTSGLSHNSALCLHQDRNGYMWIGTRDGLNKYDGVDFVTYKHIFNDSTSISNNQINCIYESDDNEIWIGTANGVNKYNRSLDVFERISLHSDISDNNPRYVRTIMELNDSNLMIGTTSGLYIIDKSTHATRDILVSQQRQDNSNTVICFHKDNNNRVWIGTRKGIYSYSNNKFERHYLKKEVESTENRFEIREIQQDRNGTFWVSTEKHGLCKMKFENGQINVLKWFDTSNSDLISNTVRKIFFNNNGDIWIGTLNGLSIYTPEYNRFSNYLYSPDNPEGISNNSIRDIIKDNQGGIWIASYAGGVNYYHPQNYLFTKITHLEKHNRNIRLKIVTSLEKDNNENLWIGTEGYGLYHYSLEKDEILDYITSENSMIISNNIKAVIKDKRDFLWIGTFNGLSRLKLSDNKNIKNFQHRLDDKNSLNHNQVHALCLQSNGNILVGTNGGGLQLLKPGAEEFQDIVGVEKNINSIYEDSNNRIWIGAQSGIYALSSDTYQIIDLKEIFGEKINQISYVNFIKEDSSNKLWIGTQWNGLFLIRDNQLFWFNTGNELDDNTVNALLQDDDNGIWVTTNKGISKIDYTEDSLGVPQIESKPFTLSQGLQGLQFYPRSALKLNSGDLIFGGINGYNQFNPRDINNAVLNPSVIFTEFRLKYKKVTPRDNVSPLVKNINETTHIVLNNNQRDFSVFFTGINFINPDNTYYRYMVSDLDDSWTDLGNERSINFTYFPVGTYELRIKASTNPEKWDDDYRSLIITVTPPWWKTWWAFIIYAVLLAIMLAIFFLYSQKWAKMKNELAMEHFQREQEKELHRVKLKFFTDISHELRTPLTLILAPLESLILNTDIPSRLSNKLSQIQRSGLRMMQMVNQILDLRKLETGHDRLNVAEGNIIRFLKEISLAFQEIAFLKKITFEFLPHEESLAFWFDRDKLEVIINNLLSNAFKYTSAGGVVRLSTSVTKGTNVKKVGLKLNPQFTYLRIDVKDSGQGINEKNLEHIYKRFYSKQEPTNMNIPGAGVGLELTRRMTELHKGAIFVESSSGMNNHSQKGSIFSVYLPVGNKAYSKNELNFDFKTSEDVSLYTNNLHKREVSLTISNDESKTKDSTQNGDFKKLLIIEDNPEVRKFIRDYFCEAYEIDEAENGKQGFKKALEGTPDLIISDVMMPVMDGIELCRKVKTDIRTSHIPVILLTARTALTFKYEGYETGADEYITKPFSAKFLSLRIKNLINQRKLIQNHYKIETLSDPGNITLTSIDEKLLKKAMDYITDNISDPSINVYTLSQHVGLSRVHFYRKIKSLTNQTAVEFIRGVRLKRAALLLKQGKISVKEVQNLVGFEDASYFRKCFKKQFGVSPSEYISENEEQLQRI